MKFKKISTLLAATVIAASALTGCGSSADQSADSAPAATDAAADAEDTAKDVADAVDETADAAAATAPGESGFTEIEIGEAQEIEAAHIEVAAVYFQAVDMLPANQLSADEADIHLEADIATTDDYYGFGAGAWVPYLTVDYSVKDESGAEVVSGSFMPMNADDGPHYGDNIKMPGEGNYKLDLTIKASDTYLLHSDEETGVEAGKAGEGLWTEPVTVSYDWEYVPVK